MTVGAYDEVLDGVIIRPMLTISDAIDLWLGDLSRRGHSPRTRDSYRRTLHKFTDQFPRDWDVAKVTTEDCERFLDGWSHRTRGTQHTIYQAVNGLYGWLYRTRRVKANPMEFLAAPKRERPDDTDVVSVSTVEVRKLLEEASTDPERICLYILAYLGPRRRAVSNLRLRDYDRERGMIRFQEKGGKTIWKPVPDPLRDVLEDAIRAGAVTEPDDYLVPMRSEQRRPGDRDDRIIWHLVREVAERANVITHVHALRAAFACFYLEERPGDLYGLQQLLGHRNPATTQVYLRRLDKTQAMEGVRSLNWGEHREHSVVAKPGTEKEGFEPSFNVNPLGGKASSEQSVEDIHEALNERLPSRAQASTADGEDHANTATPSPPKRSG